MSFIAIRRWTCAAVCVFAFNLPGALGARQDGGRDGADHVTLIGDPAALPLKLDLAPNALFEAAAIDSSMYLAQTIGDYGPDEGDWEFTLTGTGFSDKSLDNTVFGVAASLGHFLSENLEFSVRQTVNFIGIEDDDDSANASTRGALDWHFDLDQWWPFVGASVGGIYGDDVDNAWSSGLEGGVKWYVKPETFIFGMIEWVWFWESASEFDDNFDEGQWVYTLGIGFNF